MPNPGPIPKVDILSGVAQYIIDNSDLLQQKVDGKGKQSTAAQSTLKNNAALGNFRDDFELSVVDAIEKGLIGGTWAAALAKGASSGGVGNNPTVDIGDSLILLDGTALILSKTAAAEQRWEWQDAGTIRWQWVHQGDERLRLARHDASGVFQENIFSLDPTTGATQFGPAVFSMINGSADFRLGNGTSSPIMRLNKTDAGVAVVQFQNAGVVRWEMREDGGENMELLRYNSSGVFQDLSRWQEADGAFVLPGGLGIHGAAAPAQATDPGVLTDNTGGAVNNTLVAISGSGDDANINNNFADLIDQVNQLRAMLSEAAGGVGISA